MHMSEYFTREGIYWLCEENNKDCNESSIGFMQNKTKDYASSLISTL